MLRDVMLRLQRHFGVGAAAIDRGPSLLRTALVDAAVGSYVEWREESATVRHAYRRWTAAPRGERSLALAAYVAALDREERAADVHAHLLAKVAEVFGRRVAERGRAPVHAIPENAIPRRHGIRS
jgi:hypothetical protein